MTKYAQGPQGTECGWAARENTLGERTNVEARETVVTQAPLASSEGPALKAQVKKQSTLVLHRHHFTADVLNSVKISSLILVCVANRVFFPECGFPAMRSQGSLATAPLSQPVPQDPRIPRRLWVFV